MVEVEVDESDRSDDDGADRGNISLCQVFIQTSSTHEHVIVILSTVIG